MPLPSFPGNAVPAPGIALSTTTTVDDELLYSFRNYQQKGVTLEPGQGILLLGTVLARKTSTKRYVKYAAGGSGGAQTALGILRTTTDTGTDPAGQVWQGNILHAGLLVLSKVSAANSGLDVTAGILGSTTNAVEGFFKF